jgi:hypothetical protein
VKETVEMSDFLIDRAFGRQAFGADPGRYHAARPAYPDWVFDMGVSPLLAVEPDPCMATYAHAIESACADAEIERGGVQDGLLETMKRSS